MRIQKKQGTKSQLDNAIVLNKWYNLSKAYLNKDQTSELRENTVISHKKWPQFYDPHPQYGGVNLNNDCIIHVQFGYLKD